MRNSLNRGAVAGRLIGSLAIWIAAGVIFWPGLMMAYNTVVFPGYETCKRGISREMPEKMPERARRALEQVLTFRSTSAIEVYETLREALAGDA